MTLERLDDILAQFPRIRVAVIGDYFLDNYWILEESLNEISLETGKVAYQVVARRKSPGAAGTVASVLRSLDVNVDVIGFCGDDGMGYELRQEMLERGMCLDHFFTAEQSFTPTYTKPMLRSQGVEQELNRFDIKNRNALSSAFETQIIDAIDAVLPEVDALIVLDQVEDQNCGVVTDRVRNYLAEVGTRHPEMIIMADSRIHISEFRNVGIKVNNFEAQQIGTAQVDFSLQEVALQLHQSSHRPVVITRGDKGVLVCDQEGVYEIPTVKIDGSVDIVGAGDSVTASLTAALCAGASLQEAAVISNVTASLIIQQIGTTGIATRSEIREQFCQKFN